MNDFVTRDEFGALRSDVREIRSDVKKLLMRDAGEQAVADDRSRFWSIVASKSTAIYLLVGASSLALSAFATFH